MYLSHYLWVMVYISLQLSKVTAVESWLKCIRPVVYLAIVLFICFRGSETRISGESVAVI